MLERLIDSLFARSNGSRDFEVLVAFDEDDPAWPGPLGDLRVREFVWPRPITLGAKLNMLAEKARGDVWVFLGNDMVVETSDWPARIQAAVDALPGGIGVPFLNSTLSPGMPTYPVITRRIAEMTGWFMHPGPSFWFVDTVWQDVGLMIGSLFPIDVTVSAPDGLGRTHGMIDLPFWVRYFEATRPERIDVARRILGHEVPADRIAECARRTAHLSSPDFLARWGGTSESPPGPRYPEAKEKAQSHLDELGRAEVLPRTRYLDLLESVLTGTLQRDPSADPWSPGTYDPRRRAEGKDWPATALTMIGTARMRQLREACETALREGIPGDFIETGIWRGGACIYMAGIRDAWNASDRVVWGADSFKGLPPPTRGEDEGDQHHTYAQLVVSRAEVEDNFTRFNARVNIFEGWFSETLPAAPIARLSVLRLDGDMYGSTMDALLALYPKLSPGGFCIIDDYFLPGCRQAVWDYRAALFIDAPIIEIDGMGVYWRK